MLSERLGNDAMRECKRRTAAPILVDFKSGFSLIDNVQPVAIAPGRNHDHVRGTAVHGIGKRSVDAHVRPTASELSLPQVFNSRKAFLRRKQLNALFARGRRRRTAAASRAAGENLASD